MGGALPSRPPVARVTRGCSRHAPCCDSPDDAVMLGVLAAAAVGCATDPVVPGGGGDDVPPVVLRSRSPTDRRRCEGCPSTRGSPDDDFRSGAPAAPRRHRLDAARERDWYLPKVRIAVRSPAVSRRQQQHPRRRAITFDNIHARDHFTKSSGIGLCRHDDGADDHASRTKAPRFLPAGRGRRPRSSRHPSFPFVRMADVYPGAPEQLRCAATPGRGYDLQVWYLSSRTTTSSPPRPRSRLGAHDISISEDLETVSVFYATHERAKSIRTNPAALERSTARTWSATRRRQPRDLITRSVSTPRRFPASPTHLRGRAGVEVVDELRRTSARSQVLRPDVGAYGGRWVRSARRASRRARRSDVQRQMEHQERVSELASPQLHGPDPPWTTYNRSTSGASYSDFCTCQGS